jgi:hypothetical protein
MVVAKGFEHGNHAVDYTDSSHEARRNLLVRLVTPEVDALQELSEFPHSQPDGVVARIRLGLEPLGLKMLEPHTEAVAVPVQNVHLVKRAIEEHKYGV